MSISEPILSEFLTKEELPAELRRNPRTLDRWDVLGVGPPRTLVGRQVLYRRASVQRWLAAQESRGNIMPTLADFLARALPWPAPGQPGVVNLHWRSWKSRGVTGGRPFTDRDELISFVGWAQGAGGSIIRELYYCTSLQKETGPPRQGSTQPTALRNQENTLCSKAFFADIDKGYETPAQALAAVAGMCAATQSPMPTAVVVSGNGLHVYWFSTVAFPPGEWRRYAGALENLLTVMAYIMILSLLISLVFFARPERLTTRVEKTDCLQSQSCSSCSPPKISTLQPGRASMPSNPPRSQT